MNRVIGILAFLAYLAAIVAANWAVATIGVIAVGFGLVAPAAILFAGLGFTLRDITHTMLGRGWALLAIALGAGLSLLVSTPALALAAAAAFGTSELLDMLIYTPLADRGKFGSAVIASNTLGLVVDSVIFLALAFGSMEFLLGQIVGKFWVTLATLPVAVPLLKKVRARAKR